MNRTFIFDGCRRGIATLVVVKVYSFSSVFFLKKNNENVLDYWNHLELRTCFSFVKPLEARKYKESVFRHETFTVTIFLFQRFVTKNECQQFLSDTSSKQFFTYLYKITQCNLSLIYIFLCPSLILIQAFSNSNSMRLLNKVT